MNHPKIVCNSSGFTLRFREPRHFLLSPVLSAPIYYFSSASGPFSVVPSPQPHIHVLGTSCVSLPSSLWVCPSWYSNLSAAWDSTRDLESCEHLMKLLFFQVGDLPS